MANRNDWHSVVSVAKRIGCGFLPVEVAPFLHVPKVNAHRESSNNEM